MGFMIESPHDRQLQDSLLQLSNPPVAFFFTVLHNAEYTIMLGTEFQKILT